MEEEDIAAGRITSGADKGGAVEDFDEGGQAGGRAEKGTYNVRPWEKATGTEVEQGGAEEPLLIAQLLPFFEELTYIISMIIILT